MKISKYTKIFSNDGEYFLYNSMSNTFTQINDDLYGFLTNKIETGTDVSKKETGKKLWTFFYDKNIVTENDDDDILRYISIIESQRRSGNILSLTITPTMDCNFSCPYCFETKKKGNMDDTVIENIIKFIETQKKIDFIQFSWFGGEPLLAPFVIEKIINGVKEVSSAKISSGIITNGYFLNSENLELLKRCEVKTIQVSIDGIFESHNKKRFTKTDKNTFKTILKNIDEFNQKKYEINMGIRVGIDKSNVKNYEEIHSFLTERYKDNKYIVISPAFIMETTKHSCLESCMTSALEKFAFHKKHTELTRNKYFIYPSNTISECAVRNFNTWAIDAKGDVYKCWEIIGNESYKIGELTKDGIKITDQKNLNRYLFGANPFEDTNCQNCFSLPICGGGCPHRRIENKFNHQNFEACTYFKDNLEQYLVARKQIINALK